MLINNIRLYLTLLIDYVILVLRSNRVTGCVGLILLRMGVMPMKNHFDFKDMMTLGLSLLALLTFVFTFCK
ncbi:MAG: hypothetical protein E7245_14580 [Enterocloster clostridioformis]|nr:hypothetical protein [Enterocloster clostridioformis]